MAGAGWRRWVVLAEAASWQAAVMLAGALGGGLAAAGGWAGWRAWRWAGGGGLAGALGGGLAAGGQARGCY